jgi:chromosome segregation ATPase
MKNFQQTLFILLALGLCGLCVWQWYGQTLQRNELQNLEQSVYAKAAAIQGYTNSLANLDHQIAQMDTRITQLKNETKTNADLAASWKRDAARLQALSDGLTNEVAQYKTALATLETRLKDAYAAIKKQNDAVNQLVAQRDELVAKLNDSVKDRNDIVDKYNDLVRRIQTNRAAATNP